MNKYTTGGKVHKCGSPDSKYFGNPNGFKEDVKRHREEFKNKCNSANKILDSFINQDTFQEDIYYILIEELKKLKEKYTI